MTNYTAIVPSELNYLAPQKTKRGGWAVYLKDEGTNNVTFNLPKMKTPFGCTKYDDSRPNWNLELNVEDAKVCGFFDAWDAVNIEKITAVKDVVFKKPKTDEEVASGYRRMTQQNNTNYPPLLRVKVGPTTDIDVVIKNGTARRREPGRVDEIVRGTSVQCVVQCVGTYHMPTGMWGVTLVCTHLRLYPLAKESPFLDDLPSDDDTKMDEPDY